VPEDQDAAETCSAADILVVAATPSCLDQVSKLGAVVAAASLARLEALQQASLQVEVAMQTCLVAASQVHRVLLGEVVPATWCLPTAMADLAPAELGA